MREGAKKKPRRRELRYSPDAGSNDISSDMKHRTVDVRDGRIAAGEITAVSTAAVLRRGKQMEKLPH
jgi:hypothetical protein